MVRVFILRRDAAEPRDLDIERLPVRGMDVDALHLAPMIRDPLLVALCCVILRRRRIAELDFESRKSAPVGRHGLAD